MGYDNVIIGNSNVFGSGSRNGVALGYSNKGTCYWGIMIGSSNDSKTYNGARLIGDNLVASHDDQFIFGRYNARYPTLSGANFIFGCGTDTNNKANFMEANYSSCKICNNLQLATDATEVNAITAPLSNPPSADDQTLATKAYIDSLFSQVKRTQVLIDGQSTVITPGVDLPLETTFNITIPSWATTLVLGLNRVVSSVDFFTYLTIDLSTSRRYSGCLGETNDILYYNSSTKGVETLINDLSIVSIRAEN